MRLSLSPRDVPRLIAASPATVPLLAGVLVFVVWLVSDGAIHTTAWYPGAIFLLGLLVATTIVVPGRMSELPRPLVIAMAALAAYTAWSFLSIAWADARAEAWDGANRTLLYLIVFALFAGWSLRGESAMLVLGAWTLAVAGVGLITLLQISGNGDPLQYFIADRLAKPIGYPNAAAAAQLMAFWPALLLASRLELPWWARGTFAAAAVLLFDVALLSQSRGAFYSTPIALAAFFVFVPGRVRSWVTFVPIALAIAVTVPGVLNVGEALRNGQPGLPAVHGSALPVILAALAAGLVIAGLAFMEVNRPPDPDRDYGLWRRRVAWTGIGTAVAAVAVVIAFTGDPLTHLDDGWRSFKRGRPTSAMGSQSRLTAGFGSNRYDFYRVALDSFADHPLWGAGADNFQQVYIARGRSDETPRYPHSVELRTLQQTGLVGALLLLCALGGAFATAWRATRRRDRLSSSVAGAAAMVALYWLIHGSFDWFWEFAGLGAPAFAMLGLACGLAPRTSAEDVLPYRYDTPSRFVAGRRQTGWAVGLVVLATISFTAPWLAERNVQKAARSWPHDPGKAYDRLDSAARLNPLDDQPRLTEGSIALRLRDLPRARRAFEQALDRNSHEPYATLELGAIASTQGRRAEARRLLERVVELSPRDTIARAARNRVRAGKRLDVAALNRAILLRARRLVQ